MSDIKIEWLAVNDVRWKTSIDELASDVYHLPSYTRATEISQGRDAGALLIESHYGAMLVPLVLRRIHENGSSTLTDAISPYGYPGPVLSPMSADHRGSFTVSALPAMRDFLADQGVVSAFVRLHPFLGLLPTEAEHIGTVVHHGDTVLIDLLKSEDEHWSETRKGHRYEIRRSIKRGHIARVDPEMQHYDAFMDIYNESMDRVGASDSYYFDERYFTELRDQLGEHLKLWVVEIEGEIAAASLFTEYRGVVQYHLSGTRSGHLPSQPTKLLLHEVRRWAKERGNRILHLGGGLGGSDDSLFKFKAGFSSTTCPFYTWRVVADEVNYLRLTNQRFGDDATPDPEGYFPAYRMPVDAP